MYALHATYRGHATRRAELVKRSAVALSQLPGVPEVEVVGIEEIAATLTTPESVTDITMALLAAGEWAIGIGVSPLDTVAQTQAHKILGKSPKAAKVYVSPIDSAEGLSEDLAATFEMLAFVLSKRTPEGREATSLIRRGLTQTEAAAELGVSKQAVSQRLQAAGWVAETQGWRLAVRLLSRATEDLPSESPAQ